MKKGYNVCVVAMSDAAGTAAARLKCALNALRLHQCAILPIRQSHVANGQHIIQILLDSF